MNRTRTRALLAAAALGVAAIALPITSAAANNFQTCDDVPDMNKIDRENGTHNDVWGTISWGGNDLAYDLNDGWSLEVCLKAGNNVELSGPFTGAGTVNTIVKQAISHIGYIVDFAEPSDDDGNDDAIDDDGLDDGVGPDDDGGTTDGDDDGVGPDDDGGTTDGDDDGVSADDGTTDGDDDGVGPDDDGTTDGDDGNDDAIDDDGLDDGTADGDDDGVSADDGTTDDGTTDDGTTEDGTDEDGTDEDGTDEDGTEDDGVDVLPGGEVAPVDGDGDSDRDGDSDGDDTDGDVAGDDGDAAGGDGTETAAVPVEVLPATLDSRLPHTGSDVPALLAAAALALGLGGSALVRTRRRTTSA